MDLTIEVVNIYDESVDVELRNLIKAAFNSANLLSPGHLANNIKSNATKPSFFLAAKQKNSKLEPYVFAGAGFTHMNVTRDYSGFVPEYFTDASSIEAGLAADIAVSSNKIIPVVPVGIGLRYNLNSSLALNLETTYRFTRSDYIDGYSKAVNPNLNDNYYSQTIGVSYKLGRTSKQQTDCPVMKY